MDRDARGRGSAPWARDPALGPAGAYRPLSRRTHRAGAPEARAIALVAIRGRAPELAFPEVAALRDAGGARWREPGLAGAGARPRPAHRARRRAAHHVRGVTSPTLPIRPARGRVDPPRTLSWECRGSPLRHS